MIRQSDKQKLFNLLNRLNSAMCTLAGDSPSELKSVQGGHAEGTIQSSSLSTGDLAAADEIRNVSVIVSANTTVDIVYTMQDDSTFTHSYLGSGAFSQSIEPWQSPIKSVQVTELDGTSTDVIINYNS